jgi:hypothetical protein
MRTLDIALGLVAALTASTVPSATWADSLTLCGEKVDYRPTTPDPDAPNARDLIGIWIGEILGFNVPYGVALAIEGVSVGGNVQAKLVLANSTKNMQTGVSYGTKGYVLSYKGQLAGNGTTLRLADHKSVYDLQLAGTKMEGRVFYDSGYGRLFLVKQ